MQIFAERDFHVPAGIEMRSMRHSVVTVMHSRTKPGYR